jgi:hypothetical protein
MVLLNFSHPLTDEQLSQVEVLTGKHVERVIDVPVQVDHARPLVEQVRALVDAVGLSPEEWQTLPLLIVPPGYAPAAVTLLAELHGRVGYFPAIIRLRPVAGSTPTRYEVAEIINLQAARDTARERRKP